MPKVMLTRRDFLKGAVFGAAAFAGAAALKGNLLELPGTLAAPPTPGSRNPLYIPPVISPTSAILTEAVSTVDVGGGQLSSVWAYNGSLPGPTLKARRGTTSTIVLTNQLAQETITHWHGMVVDDQNDGHPRFAIPPGGSYLYTFLINQRAAMNWYHPHPHLLTGEQVSMGLAGGFIITDSTEEALGLPSGTYEVPLVVRDASFDSQGNMNYRSQGGTIPMVNGTLNPKLDVDTARYRFRVLCGAQNRVFGLRLADGSPFTLIGNDGGLLKASIPVTQVDMAPGERVDLIVDFRGRPVGSSVMLKDAFTGWDMLEFVVTRTVNDTGTVPTLLSTIDDLSNPIRTRDFSFDGMSRVNGQVYDVNRIDFQVPFGETELWRFSTGGNGPHPVHVHGASFQVQSRTGGRGQVFPWEQGWKDTVLLEDNETVEILIRFDRFPGIYLIHCHRLEHEDMGMMSNFQVLPPPPPSPSGGGPIRQV